MAKLSLLVLFGASVLAGKPPERAPKAINGSHSNFTYGYSLQGKNDAYQEQIEHRKGKHVEGSFAVHLPDGQSVSDVEYTADEQGFHPIVRLSTKTNNSQVTSHFALGQSAVKRLSEQNEKIFESISESRDSPSVTELIAKYEEKASNGFEPKKTDQRPLIKYDPTNDDDTISQVLTSLFPDGIPKKYEELLNTTDDLDFEIKTDYPLTTTYISKNTEEVTTSPFNISTEKIKVRRGINTGNSKDSTRFPQKERAYQHLISDEEVLQINDAAENFTEGDKTETQMFPSVEQVRVYEPQAENQRGGFGDLHPFESPIIVEEQNDNLFASSSGNNENYVAPPFKEIRIIPADERYVRSRNYNPERRINLKILDRGRGFQQALLKAASAQDLDTFQKIVEESFSHSPEYKTEAPSRAFLRELEQKSIKYTPSYENQGRYKFSEEKISKEENIHQIEEAAQRLLEKYARERKREYTRERSEENDDEEKRNKEEKPHLVPKYENNPNAYKSTVIQPSEDFSIESRSEKGDTLTIEKLRPISQKLFTQSHPHSNDKDDEDSNSSLGISSTSERPREKTFVEIAKAVNIQNLLIKEDEDSIERHEEYLQPLSFGDRLTHRIESKFMKTKPWEHYEQNPVGENQITLIPVTIRPSISYALPPEHIEYHPPEYHNFQQYNVVSQNAQEHHQIEEHPQAYQQQHYPQDQQHTEDPNQNFSEDPEEKYVEESRQVSKLHTRVNYNDIEMYPKKFKPGYYDLRQSVATPVVPKYFPRPTPIVEKIVEKRIKVPFPAKEYVEKMIAKPVHVEKIIDRSVPVPYLVAVDRIVETPVHVPYPVEHVIEVEKFVETEIPIEVEKFVDRPVLIPVEKIIDRPYQTFQSQPVNVQQQISDNINTMIKQQQQQLWPNKQMLINRNPKQMTESEFQNVGNVRNDYYGPVPPQYEYSHWGGQHFKRSSDFGRNLRMEYGFKPPLIPSIEIDDQGIPVNRNKDS